MRKGVFRHMGLNPDQPAKSDNSVRAIDLYINQAPSYKTFFMLNSAEHVIFSANKYENANNSWHFYIY